MPSCDSKKVQLDKRIKNDPATDHHKDITIPSKLISEYVLLGSVHPDLYELVYPHDVDKDCEKDCCVLVKCQCFIFHDSRMLIFHLNHLTRLTIRELLLNCIGFVHIFGITGVFIKFNIGLVIYKSCTDSRFMKIDFNYKTRGKYNSHYSLHQQTRHLVTLEVVRTS